MQCCWSMISYLYRRWTLVSHPGTVNPFKEASFKKYLSTMRLYPVTIGNQTFLDWTGVRVLATPLPLMLVDSPLAAEKTAANPHLGCCPCTDTRIFRRFLQHRAHVCTGHDRKAAPLVLCRS